MHVCSTVCMYACMHVWIYACMHVCMYAGMQVCRYAGMHVCMYAWMHGCMDVWMHGCMDAWMHGCMYACMYACMHVWMYVSHVCMYTCLYTKCKCVSTATSSVVTGICFATSCSVQEKKKNVTCFWFAHLGYPARIFTPFEDYHSSGKLKLSLIVDFSIGNCDFL